MTCSSGPTRLRSSPSSGYRGRRTRRPVALAAVDRFGDKAARLSRLLRHPRRPVVQPGHGQKSLAAYDMAVELVANTAETVSPTRRRDQLG